MPEGKYTWGWFFGLWLGITVAAPAFRTAVVDTLVLGPNPTVKQLLFAARLEFLLLPFLVIPAFLVHAGHLRRQKGAGKPVYAPSRTAMTGFAILQFLIVLFASHPLLYGLAMLVFRP